MPSANTIADVFAIAIANEETARELYQDLAGRFSHVPAAAEFWQGMAADEQNHSRALQGLRDSLTGAQLAETAVRSMVGMAARGAELIKSASPEMLYTLEDAYQLASQLERSEVNTLYEVLMTRYLEHGPREDLIISEIRTHTVKLVTFTQQFGEAEERQKIIAASDIVSTEVPDHDDPSL